MKKFLCVILTLVMLTAALPLSASANAFYDGYPVILVPGYASASLCYEEDGEVHTAWGWKLDDLMPGVTENLDKIYKSASRLVKKNQTDVLVQTIADCLSTLLEPMRCNPDGTSVKDVRPVLFDAAQTCDSYLNKTYPDGDYRVELDMTAALDQMIGEENVFYFNCDFRMSAVDCAAELDKYITGVKAYTGAEKVNLIAVSHGGLITTTYLAMYQDKNDVFNVVMDEPALAGAGLAADMMQGVCDFDEDTFVQYLEYHAQCETDFNILVKAQRLGFLDDGVKAVLPLVRDAFLYWGSIWDFIPPAEYDALKEKYLDAQKSAALIEKSDFVHKNIMGKHREIFQSAQKRGIRVNIIAGTGKRILTGKNQISDGIIAAVSSTGAKCAPYGKRFSDAYAAEAYSSGRVLSPAMDIDATNAYLPKNTWFVNGLFHGMEFWDEYSRSLLFKLLLTPAPLDVESDPAYPQFHDTTSVTTAAYAQFAKPGYITPQDDCLTVTNTSQKYTMYLLSVKCSGVELTFENTAQSIPAGESRTIRVRGSLPAGITYAEVTVTYLMLGSVTPLAQRRQYFTAVNGAQTAQQTAEPYTDAGFPTGFSQSASKRTQRMMEILGLREFAETVYDAADAGWGRLTGLFIKK